MYYHLFYTLNDQCSLPIHHSELASYIRVFMLGFTFSFFGRAIPFNRTSWGEWEVLAEAPAIRPILSLYNLLIEAKVSVFFLTGRGENKRSITEQNLRQEGYTGWTDLILRYCYFWLYNMKK